MSADQLELAVPIEVDCRVNQRDYDRMVAYNRDLLDARNEIHQQMLDTGAALSAWADGWDGDTPPGLVDGARLLMHLETEWSRP